MVRLHASQENKHLVVLFANAVTILSVQLSPKKDTVGRSCAHSIFDVFSKVCPKAIREHSRNGVTLTEFNKALEHDGFERVRRKQS
eukprot:993988-Rhodomonas_salina.1